MREPTRLAGIEAEAKKVDLGLENTLGIGQAQNFKATRTSQSSVTGDYPSGEQQNVIEERGLKVVHARVTNGHAAAKLKAALDRQAEFRRVRPRDVIQPLKVNGIVDVLVLVDFLGPDPERARVGRRQSEVVGYQCCRQDTTVGTTNSRVDRKGGRAPGSIDIYTV
jgi:hypothetical protein